MGFKNGDLEVIKKINPDELRRDIDNLGEQLNDMTNKQGDIAQLNTNDKSSLVNALKEVKTQAVSNQNSITGMGQLKFIGVYATLSALQTAYSTGTNGIALVTADGYGYYWNGSAWTKGAQFQSTGIANDGVTPPLLLKGDYVVPTWVNILDTSKSTSGYVDATGKLTIDSNWKNSDFIPVVAGQQYQIDLTANGGTKIYSLEGTVYDSSKTVIGSIASISMPTTWTAPANAAFVKVNYGSSYANQVYFKQLQNITNRYSINWLDVKLSNLTKEITDYIDGKGNITNDQITPPLINKNDYLTSTWVDILNRSTSIPNKIITTAGTEATFGGFSHSDYIPVVSGKQYQVFVKDNSGGTTSTIQLDYFDSAKVFLGSIGSTPMPYTWTAPTNAAYAIINYGTAYESEVYFKETQQLATKYPVNWLDVKLANLNKEVTDYINSALGTTLPSILSQWSRKKANFKGDSITYGAYTPAGHGSVDGVVTNKYCDLVGQKLGLSTVRNYSASGISISSTSSVNGSLSIVSTYSQMDNDADLVVIAGGTNDYGTNVVLGTIADTTDISFYGALDVLCRGLIEKYVVNQKKVVFISPIHRAAEGANSAGYTLAQYKQAILDVCTKYGIPVIDGFTFGFTCKDSTIQNTFINDGLHPNEAGHQMYANYLAPKLISL